MNIKFITIEGGEGSGKTSVIIKLIDELNKRGYQTLSTREPGGSKIAEEIREVILNVENTNMDYMTEALLYAASRRQHLEEVVKPAIKDGKLVICDRYVDSSLAYQGHARGLGIDNVYEVNMYATGGFMPDLTIFIDVPPEVGLSRIKKNNRSVDRLDLEKMNFHNLVHEGYLKVYERFPERIVRIDGNKPIDEVYEDLLKIIDQKLSN